MQPIKSILFEPVGCLAEFPAEPFQEIALRLFARKKKPSKSGSRAYWHLLNLMAEGELDESARKTIESLEIEAVAGAAIYEDVIPALTELGSMGVRLVIASSLSTAAIAHFLAKCAASELFREVWSRDTARGTKAAPLAAAATAPEHSMFLTDTAEGLKTAKSVGVNAILMMNDPDEARRLSMHEPAGGIVSLHELPDFVRLVAAENARRVPPV